MSWLGVLLSIGMVSGAILECLGFNRLDRAHETRKSTKNRVIFNQEADLMESHGVNYCVLGVALIMVGGTYFRLGGV